MVSNVVDNEKAGRWRAFLLYEYTLDFYIDEILSDKVRVHVWGYYAVIIAYVITQAATGYFITYPLMETPIKFMGTFMGLSWTQGGLILVIQITVLILSFGQVGSDELGQFTFFGALLKKTGKGLVLRPFLIVRLEKDPRLILQDQYPNDPEGTFKGSDKEFFDRPESERQNLRLPFRIVSGGQKGTPSRETGEREDENALDSQMTLEVTAYARWRINNQLIFRVRVGSIKEARKQMNDTVFRFLTEVISSQSPAETIKRVAEINSDLAKRLRELTNDWGITIVESAIHSPDIGKDPSKELQNVVSEKARATQTRVAARATKTKLTEEGVGRAAATLAELEALATGAEKLGVDGDVVVGLQSARAIADGEDVTIFVDGGSGSEQSLLGIASKLASGGAQAIDKRKKRVDSKKSGDGGADK